MARGEAGPSHLVHGIPGSPRWSVVESRVVASHKDCDGCSDLAVMLGLVCTAQLSKMTQHSDGNYPASHYRPPSSFLPTWWVCLLACLFSVAKLGTELTLLEKSLF